MAGGQRLKRMADSVQRELSELIRQELKDPRLGGLVTISGVKVSPDLGYADVYAIDYGNSSFILSVGRCILHVSRWDRHDSTSRLIYAPTCADKIQYTGFG